MGKRELIALLNLSSWRLVVVERLFLAVPRGCLLFVFVVFPDHTHLLFLHIFIIVKYYIFAAKRLDHPLFIVALNKNTLKFPCNIQLQEKAI